MSKTVETGPWPPFGMLIHRVAPLDTGPNAPRVQLGSAICEAGDNISRWTTDPAKVTCPRCRALQG